MPALSDSGHLPAVRIQTQIQQAPPISPDLSLVALLQVSRQFLKASMLAETNFGLPSHQYSLCGATKEEWFLFCNQCHANTIGYSENPSFPDLSRRDFANTQMRRSGRMALCHNPNADVEYLLVPEKIAVSTCADFARTGQWCTSLCCSECHEEQDFRETFFAGSDPLRGIKGRQCALVCCRCEKLLPEWHPNRVLSVQELRTHEIFILNSDDDDECLDDDCITRHV